MTRALPRYVTLGLLLIWVVAAPKIGSAAKLPPIHVTSADDPALATMLLVGQGQTSPVLLFDPRDQTALTRFAADNDRRALRCIRSPRTPAALGALIEKAAGAPCTSAEDLPALARALWPQAREAIAVPSDNYEWLLRAAAFAGATRSALIPIEPGRTLSPDTLDGWKIETLYLTPGTSDLKSNVTIVPNLVEIATPEALTGELLRRLGTEHPTAVVVANPRDRLGMFSPSSLSMLAPLVSAHHRAPLVLTGATEPEAVEREVLAFIDDEKLQPTHIILVGDELALRSHRVPDPVLAAGGPEAIGGGREIRVELFSQIQHELPQDFSVGRIVAEDVAQASTSLARQLHESLPRKAKPVVMLSNADEMFALGETISRTTVSELRNLGVPVQAYFRDKVTPTVIQQSLRDTELLIWEGHARDLTLEERGGIAVKSAPTLVILQGCYTLDRSDPFILMERGTQAVVATSAAIYSASGSAFARTLFDALLYEDADLGTAVRNARNYLLALTKLKRLRNHKDWHKTYRAALAFALWGDPTMRPDLRKKRPSLTPARWKQSDNELVLTIPKGRLPAAAVGRYRSRPVPRAMLGSLLLREGKAETRKVKELFFTVQHTAPELVSACAPTNAWQTVSLFAPRTDSLTVLARPDWELMPDVPKHGTFRFPLTPDAMACPPASPEEQPAAPQSAVSIGSA